MLNQAKLIQKFDTVNGTKFHYSISSLDNAKNIILVHGIGLSSRYMLPLAKELSSKYTVYAIDLPGFGKSESQSGADALNVAVNSLQTFIEQNKITDPILIGNSFGCQVIIKYLKQNSSDAPAVLTGPTINTYERNHVMQIIRWLQNLKNEPTKNLSWIPIKDIIECGIVKVFKVLSVAIKDKPEEGLEKLNNRILFLRGDRDAIAPQKWLEFLANKNKSFSVSEFANAGHALNYNSPKSLAIIIDMFIDSESP